MAHTTVCETAEGYSCTCSCGGALHGAVLIRGFCYRDPEAQDEAVRRAQPLRWSSGSAAMKQSTINDGVADRHPAMTALISELIVALIDHLRRQDQLDPIECLAREISEDAGDEVQRHLGGGGSKSRKNRHLWCVIVATICRLYDQTTDFLGRGANALVDDLMGLLRQGISTQRSEVTQVRDVYQYKHRVAAAFRPDDYDFLGGLAKTAIKAVITAIGEVGEAIVMRHLRLIGAVVCPDPDRHPDVVKYCIWPLLRGPFEGMLKESTEAEMRTWLRNAYPVLPQA